MSKLTDCYLCLVPNRNTKSYEFLYKLIIKTAAKYQTPVFDPHVTLFGSVEGAESDIRDKARLVARRLMPFRIQLGKIDSNGIYFQILFSKVKQTALLLHAHNVAKEVFGLDNRKYFPHLSFAYGNLSEKQTTALKKSLEKEGLISKIDFTVEGIELWHTRGAVEEWYVIETFPFSKS